ncbi:acyl-CoA dehydrogenase family protein [Zavarzinia aquatilis]|uniref:Pimeloyl-CoA dehydrogenase large subunit n=1 Tax=Zavarzinia aquatilis TaxID=2211142 RepID=A0A317E5F9_9PROT|nr:acyl-CoA dehydrogenase family protein [Zavarzinia aquatilis]PWR21416.1 pimeloyl-CoA dehydrogenase large subunit [Zavarzinia aquatilis]
MDLSFSAEDLAFQREVRSFIAENYPADIKARFDAGLEPRKEDFVRWQKILFEKGWVAPAWPKEYGGTGWTATQKYIFQEELGAANTPGIIPFGLSMVGPVIYTFATEEQKKRFLPGILSSDVWWCQGYSEPGSGSDLASLKTKAVRQGDKYIVNGSKTWTTMAQWADWIFCLVRTDSSVKQQEGISFLLFDMKSPGVTVRPIITMDGGHEVNECFFDNVEVPVENLIGQEGMGWTYAKFLLGHERSGIAAVARSKRGIAKLKQIANTEQSDGSPLIEDPDYRRKLAELEIDLTALEYTELRTLARESQGKGPGPESSILKIKGTEIQQAITELAVEAAGYYAFAYNRRAMDGANEPVVGPAATAFAAPSYFNMRKTSIYGGSNEIQKNIIAKMVLGL